MLTASSKSPTPPYTCDPSSSFRQQCRALDGRDRAGQTLPLDVAWRVPAGPRTPPPAITRFAEPTTSSRRESFRRQDIVHNLIPRLLPGVFGTSHRADALGRQKKADLLIVIGARLGE